MDEPMIVELRWCPRSVMRSTNRESMFRRYAFEVIVLGPDGRDKLFFRDAGLLVLRSTVVTIYTTKTLRLFPTLRVYSFRTIPNKSSQ